MSKKYRLSKRGQAQSFRAGLAFTYISLTLKIEAYYDIIKELIFAHIYKAGYNCTNHLCLIAYLKEKIEDFDFETQKIDELRTIRNDINYRGFFVKKEYLEKNELEFKNIIKRLKEEIIRL